MDLEGKTALVTGGGVRIGRAIALALAGRGCDLFIHYGRSGGPATRRTETTFYLLHPLYIEYG